MARYTNEQIQEIKRELGTYLELTGRRADGKPFHNPFRRDRHPSLSFYKGANGTLCRDFATDETYDIFDFIREDYGIPDFRSQVAKAMQILGFGVSEEERREVRRKQAERQAQITAEERRKKEAQEAKDELFVTESIASFPFSPAEVWLEARGIGTPTAIAWHVGYGEIDAWTRDEHWERHHVRGLVIPRDDGKGYTLRNIDILPDQRSDLKCRRSGDLWVYKAPRLYTERVVYITEGEIDGMSIDEITGHMGIAIGGAGTGWLERYVIQHGTPNARVVIATDMDSAGEEKARKIKNIIEQVGGTTTRLIMPTKDPNAWLTEDREGFAEALRETWREIIRRR